MSGQQSFGPSLTLQIKVTTLGTIFSLISALSGCQTAGTAKEAEDAVVESQRQIVREALDSGKPEAALSSLRYLLRQHPDDPSMHNLMGLTQLSLRNNPRAIKEFQIAYKIDKNVATGLNLSSALISSGDLSRAVKLLNQLIIDAEKQNYPYRERLFHNLGFAYSKDRKFSQAETWLKRALDENPTFFLSHLELAHIYENSNRQALAIQSYQKAVDYCLICFEPVQSLASLYVRKGQTLEAQKLLIKYGKTDGINADDKSRAKSLYSQLTAGDTNGAARG
ncbi:MAG: tetratricopeptide repeat protein [Deltaproteobacteria bacterium]|nr:tetratricopeptide repeat protein [Deltaproteobacteria bacterium]